MKKITREEYKDYERRLKIVDDGSYSITKLKVNGVTEYWYVPEEKGKEFAEYIISLTNIT